MCSRFQPKQNSSLKEGTDVCLRVRKRPFVNRKNPQTKKDSNVVATKEEENQLPLKQGGLLHDSLEQYRVVASYNHIPKKYEENKEHTCTG